jgi:hypothetical protein
MERFAGFLWRFVIQWLNEHLDNVKGEGEETAGKSMPGQAPRL